MNTPRTLITVLDLSTWNPT